MLLKELFLVGIVCHFKIIHGFKISGVWDWRILFLFYLILFMHHLRFENCLKLGGLSMVFEKYIWIFGIWNQRITCLVLFHDHQTSKKSEHFILEPVLDLQNYCKDRSEFFHIPHTQFN